MCWEDDLTRIKKCSHWKGQDPTVVKDTGKLKKSTNKIQKVREMSHD